VVLWPLALKEAEYLDTEAAVSGYPGATECGAQAGLRLRFAGAGAKLSQLGLDDLPLYLDGEKIAGELYRQILGDAVAVVGGRPGAATADWVRLPLPRPHGFEEDCALLPHESRSFRGYRVLTEYFACPERFLFARLAGLRAAFSSCEDQCEIVLLFGRRSDALAGAVSVRNLRLFATPAINLFQRRIDRVEVRSHEHEYLVEANKARPKDFEIYRLLDVKAELRNRADPRPVKPLFAAGARSDGEPSLYYTTRLAPRLTPNAARAEAAPGYASTSTWISLTCPGDPVELANVHQLDVSALVTNRELAMAVSLGGGTDFSMQGAPVRAVTVVRPPTRPRPPLGMGDAAWRVIGHLTTNHTTLAPESDEPVDASLLREHLSLYDWPDDPVARSQIAGVRSIRAQPVTRRVPGRERMGFARGKRIRISLNSNAYGAGRLFLFATVLEHFLGEFPTINTFAECSFETEQEGVFAQWPPRMGRRQNI
jgi:type VI secretion system protein ImpG